MAKGALVDVLQSYGLNLYRCVPTKTIEVGTLNFIIRGAVTFLVVWSALHLVAEARTRMFRREPAASGE